MNRNFVWDDGSRRIWILSLLLLNYKCLYLLSVAKDLRLIWLFWHLFYHYLTRICHFFFFQTPLLRSFLFGVGLQPEAYFSHYLNLFMIQKFIDIRSVVPAAWETIVTALICLQTKRTRHGLLISCECYWHLGLILLMDHQSSTSHFWSRSLLKQWFVNCFMKLSNWVQFLLIQISLLQWSKSLHQRWNNLLLLQRDVLDGMMLRWKGGTGYVQSMSLESLWFTCNIKLKSLFYHQSACQVLVNLLAVNFFFLPIYYVCYTMWTRWTFFGWQTTDRHR